MTRFMCSETRRTKSNTQRMEYELVVSHGLLWKGSAGARHAAADRQEEEGDDRIIDATGHADERMVQKTYDRRRPRKVRATR
ncbi:hypothetical protein [Burkholderia ubonensis]|uniref:hypothetical protein n=1 Tax=Burkholderia ubonensis TaxID=101571 RepID=UPI000A9880F7|nr:hypothetical protein [Burkholderia ubonensis]